MNRYLTEYLNGIPQLPDRIGSAFGLRGQKYHVQRQCPVCDILFSSQEYAFTVSSDDKALIENVTKTRELAFEQTRTLLLNHLFAQHDQAQLLHGIFQMIVE